MNLKAEKIRLSILDTTLRDGQQTQGVDFSVDAKKTIARALDELGVDYVEGGWPGANPVDDAFFRDAPTLKTASMTAFGMTKRVGISASNDTVLGAVIGAGAPTVCLVGKTHDFHVTTALETTLEENLAAIRQSVAHVIAQGREAMFDAEHFFDGFKANPDYALDCVAAAAEAGARWVVLCDTNGGTLPHEVREIVAEVIERVPGDRLGIHTHNDTEHAVANTLAAIDAGVRHLQGTLNGLGERCGNANLVTLIPTLLLKEPYASRYELGVDPSKLGGLTKLSRMLDRLLDRAPDPHAPYVGQAAFAHKAGLHASAILKDPTTYEHIPPQTVGNARVVPMSSQAGRANLRQRLAEAGVEVDREDPRLGRLLERVKELEESGYAYDSAEASFVVLAHDFLGLSKSFFDVERFRVSIERRNNAVGQMVTVSEAVVVIVDGEGQRLISAAQSPVDPDSPDHGPVDALARALQKDLGSYQGYIEDLELVDFRVRIIGRGTDAVTRVWIDSQDGQGQLWTSMGVSANVVDASFQALVDAIRFKLIRDGAPG